MSCGKLTESWKFFERKLMPELVLILGFWFHLHNLLFVRALLCTIFLMLCSCLCRSLYLFWHCCFSIENAVGFKLRKLSCNNWLPVFYFTFFHSFGFDFTSIWCTRAHILFYFNLWVLSVRSHGGWRGKPGINFTASVFRCSPW